MEGLLYFIIFSCGVLMCAVQLFSMLKKEKLGHSDILYGSVLCIIVVWIFTDAFNYAFPGVFKTGMYLTISVMLITLLAIFAYLFTVSLKRDIWFVDVLLMFPVLLITMLHIVESGVLMSSSGLNLPVNTMYWLASILLIAFLNINVLYRISSLIKGTWAYKRVSGLIAAESIGLTLAVVSNVFLYPWLLSAKIGSFFLAFSLFIYFWVDRSIMRRKVVYRVSSTNARQQALKRICEFL